MTGVGGVSGLQDRDYPTASAAGQPTRLWMQNIPITDLFSNSAPLNGFMVRTLYLIPCFNKKEIIK